MKLHATDRDLLIKESERLISGSVKIYECEFTFDESWDGYTVTAVFSTNGSRLVNMAVVDGKCDIPSEVLRPNARIRVGIFGTDGERSRPTTYSEWISVEQGADISGNSAQPPTPSVYEQWMNALDEKHDEWNENEQARIDAENARQEAEEARAEAEVKREDLETGYVAQAEAWAREAEEQANEAESWANKAKEAVGGDFATTAEAQGYANTAEANAKRYTDEQIAVIPKPDVSAEINAHNTDESAHGDIRNAVGNVASAVTTAQATANSAVDAASAAQITANSKASTASYTVVAPVSWTEDATNGGFTQTVAVSGILATDNPIADVVLGSDVEANALYLAAWALVTRITTANGSITLYANGSAPETAFSVQLKAVR